MTTALQSLKRLPAAAWIGMAGLLFAVGVYGWSFPRGMELGFDEGSHFLETARPWDSPYFHTLYAWYAHGVWRIVGEKVVHMRWFALVAQLGCTAWLVYAARGWLARLGCATRLPSLAVLMPVSLLWSLMCYIIGSVTVTYTSLSGWFSTLWLAAVLQCDQREARPGLVAISLVWMLALLDCTAKPSTGAFLLAASFLLTLGWRLRSRQLVARIQVFTGAAILGVIAVVSSGLLGTSGAHDAWDLSVQDSPLVNFVTWAWRYLNSSALQATLAFFWREPLREAGDALAHDAVAAGVMAGLMVVTHLLRRTPAKETASWVAPATLGVLFTLLARHDVVLPTWLGGQFFVAAGAFAVVVVCRQWLREPVARVAMLSGVLIAQLTIDAVEIITPGEVFFMGSGHSFRIIFMALLGVTCAASISGDGWRGLWYAGGTTNTRLVLLLLLFIPVLGWFGSGCTLGARSGYHYGIWALLIVIMAARIGDEAAGPSSTLVVVTMMTLLAANEIFICRAPRPIAGGFPTLTQETKVVKVGPRSEPLVFSHRVAGMISRVKSTLKDHGFHSGDPILAFYDFPGLVFLAGGRSPGATWYMTPGYEHPSSGVSVAEYNGKKLAAAQLDDLKRAFVLQTDGETTFAPALLDRGIRFPADYEHCATVQIPPAVNGRKTLDIWKPKAAAPSASATTQTR